MKLTPKAGRTAPKGPIVLAIMDGVGIGAGDAGDMVAKASTPTLDWLKDHAAYTQLKAHGHAVGMPSDDDMGNSEVGHNAIGSGQVFSQGAKLVQEAIASGAVYEGETWQGLTSQVRETGGTLHFITLLSDGNVHSHLDHLFSMLRQAKGDGANVVRIHTLLDGRDVNPTSADHYMGLLNEVLEELNDDKTDMAVASGGGRLYITMDRYGADWPMVERGWNVHVHGQGREFECPLYAIKTLREETPGVIDQDLGSFVIYRDGKPVGPIVDGDSVVLCNFRGDRAMEIARAFDEGDEFDFFDRGARPDVYFAGIMEYDGDLKIPQKFLVTPPAIANTMGEYLAATGISQLAISETQKYGHVTYFFNGNKSGKFDDVLEDYVEIPSDNLPFEQRPWMKASEITDVVLESLAQETHNFIRINYPNGDMVGHTGNLLAVEISVEATDLSIARLLTEIERTGGVLLVTADHGNADEMFEVGKDGQLKLDTDGNRKPKTCHTLNPVPFFVYDPAGNCNISLKQDHNLGISSIAATIMEIMGYEAPEMYDPSVLA